MYCVVQRFVHNEHPAATLFDSDWVCVIVASADIDINELPEQTAGSTRVRGWRIERFR